MDLSLAFVGLVFGIVLGMTSMGGGSLMAPFLMLGLGMNPVLAVGTDLVYGALTKIVGSWVYWRNGLVDFRIVRRLCIGSLPGGLTAALLVSRLRAGGWDADHFVRTAVAVLLVGVAAVMVLRLFAAPRPIENARLRRHAHGWGTIAYGSIVGFSVGLTSIGSGALVAPFLLMIYGLTPAELVGTDLFHAAALVTVSALPAVAHGSIDWPIVVALVTGSIPGVVIGGSIAARVPPVVLRVSLAGVMVAAAVKLL